MVKYVLKRILLAVLILFGVSVILYFLIRMMPVSYFDLQFKPQLDNGSMTQEDLDRIKAIYGLDDNSFLGILKGYWSWMTNFLKGDMGMSFKYKMEVSEVIKSKMGISFSISLVSLILEMLIAIPLGIKCATNQYGKFDYTVTVICMVAMAFPSFFLGNLFIKWFAVDLGWFETGGLNSSSLPSGASG
ncbi:MAG: ABC transporter permease, partial [Clostridia bacterium]|nr:ABC transporter permease [Clostridia bacterium]